MLSTQLRIKARLMSDSFLIKIDDYKGPGEYELTDDGFTMVNQSIGKVGLTDGERMTLKITSDFKGVIEGEFSATKLVQKGVQQPRYYAIRNGQFEAKQSQLQNRGNSELVNRARAMRKSTDSSN